MEQDILQDIQGKALTHRQRMTLWHKSSQSEPQEVDRKLPIGEWALKVMSTHFLTPLFLYSLC